MTPIAGIGNILNSSVWTVLTTVLAAAAIAVTIILYLRQRSKKSLTYEIKVTRLVNIHRAAKDRIKILYEDEMIEEAHLVEARVQNSGNVPILPSDFEQELRLEFGQNATPLTVEVPNRKPSDLGASAYLFDHAVGVEKLLLNPGDEFTFRTFVSDLKGEVVCRARVVGVPELTDAGRQIERSTLKRLWDESYQAAIFGAALVLVVASASALYDAAIGGDSSPQSEPSKDAQQPAQGAKTGTLFVLDDGQRICGVGYRVKDETMFIESGAYDATLVPRDSVVRVQSNRC